MTRQEIFEAIEMERKRQRDLHGLNCVDNPEHSDHYRLAVVAEEFGEVAKAVNELDPLGVREELIQLAATAIGWLEAME